MTGHQPQQPDSFDAEVSPTITLSEQQALAFVIAISSAYAASVSPML